MPELNPFPGLRYSSTTDISRFVAPPYDVIDEIDREQLEALDPHNAVRLILPRDRDGSNRYAVAAATLETWQSEGALRRDDRPSFTIVRMQYRGPDGDDRSTLGVIGALVLPGERSDTTILPHERTLSKAKSDRLALLEATRANLDPIWGLSLTTGLSRLLEPVGAPDALCSEDTCRHEAWIVTDPARIDEIRASVERTDLVLADGHHRFETAQRYRTERSPGDLGASAVMALVVELAEDQLSIQAIHRALRLPGGVDVREALTGAFELVDAGANEQGSVRAFVRRAAAEGALGLIDGRGLVLARPHAAARRATDAEWPRTVSTIDAALVESAVRPRIPDAEWDYRADAETLADMVRTGTADAALILRPVTVDQTRAVAAAGARMPQKTTFFHPKPRTGIVFRTLD